MSRVIKLLNGLSNCKATGLDKISGRILKAAANSIAPSLTHIFNHGLISNCFPDEWKMARLVPIHKKGPRDLIENSRPISILPVISKIMERILYEQIYQYLRDNSLLTEYQYVFVKCTQLFCLCFIVQIAGMLIWTVKCSIWFFC